MSIARQPRNRARRPAPAAAAARPTRPARELASSAWSRGDRGGLSGNEQTGRAQAPRRTRSSGNRIGIEKVAVRVGHLCERRARPEQRAVLRRRAHEWQVSQPAADSPPPSPARRLRPRARPAGSQQLPHRQRSHQQDTVVVQGNRGCDGNCEASQRQPTPPRSFGRLPAEQGQARRSQQHPVRTRLKRVVIACRDARNQQRHGAAGQAHFPPGEKPKRHATQPKAEERRQSRGNQAVTEDRRRRLGDQVAKRRLEVQAVGQGLPEIPGDNWEAYSVKSSSCQSSRSEALPAAPSSSSATRPPHTNGQRRMSVSETRAPHFMALPTSPWPTGCQRGENTMRMRKAYTPRCADREYPNETHQTIGVSAPSQMSRRGCWSLFTVLTSRRAGP